MEKSAQIVESATDSTPATASTAPKVLSAAMQAAKAKLLRYRESLKGEQQTVPAPATNGTYGSTGPNGTKAAQARDQSPQPVAPLPQAVPSTGHTLTIAEAEARRAEMMAQK